jgi:hypothetical protein
VKIPSAYANRTLLPSFLSARYIPLVVVPTASSHVRDDYDDAELHPDDGETWLHLGSISAASKYVFWGYYLF